MSAMESGSRVEAESSSADPGLDETTQVDYATSYLRDVLRLDEARGEEGAEEELRSQAKDMGIMLDSSPHLLPHSVPTSSTHLSRRSVSVYSITSQSTGITSSPSEAFREPAYQRSRARLSIQDYDTFLARGTADEHRTSLSFSTPSTPADSALSLPLCSPEPSPRRQSRVLKGLSILKLHRQDQIWRPSESCPHCPPGFTGQRRAVHKLPCGHKLCTQALRNTVHTALQRRPGAVPCCCGRPISGTLVQYVATHEEQEYLLEKLEQWDEAISLASSMPGDEKELHLPRTLPVGQPHRTSADAPPMEGVDVELDALRDREDYKQLQQEQADLRDRTLTWAADQRASLAKKHERLRKETKDRQDAAEEDMMDTHERAMADAEDRQVKAESQLREAQAQERRDNATALRHLEAYCAGEYSTGEAHNRPITDQARAELAKARRVQETMEPKHDSAINVLRGEQERRINLRRQRHERELQELRRAHRKEELEFERSCTADMLTFEEFVVEKQQRLTARWALQGAIFAKQVEIETGVKRAERLFTMQWPTGELENVVGV